MRSQPGSPLHVGLVAFQGDATRTVCLFQYTGPNCWPQDQGYPVDSGALATGRRSLIDLIGEVQKLQERTDDRSPVVVHCK